MAKGLEDRGKVSDLDLRKLMVPSYAAMLRAPQRNGRDVRSRSRLMTQGQGCLIGILAGTCLEYRGESEDVREALIGGLQGLGDGEVESGQPRQREMQAAGVGVQCGMGRRRRRAGGVKTQLAESPNCKKKC